MTTTNIKSAIRALAFSGALSLFAAVSASAAIVTDGTAFNPGVALTGTANFGGTAISDTLFNFAESPAPPEFTGTLRTVVVKNAGGTLDFYYQLNNIASANPPADIWRFTIDGFDPFATGVMDYSTNGLTGIAGLVNGLGPVANKAPKSADRDTNLGSGVGFTFASNPGLPFFDPNNVNTGDTSFFMIVRTNATAFTNVSGIVSGFGTALVQTAGPTAVSAIPEPGSALVGLAVMGLCGSGLFRRNRKPVLA